MIKTLLEFFGFKTKRDGLPSENEILRILKASPDKKFILPIEGMRDISGSRLEFFQFAYDN